MSLSYDEIVELIATIDDCFMMDEIGHSQVAVVSRQDNMLQILRSLKCGDLVVTIDSQEGDCQYIQGRKNTAASTGAASYSVNKLTFSTGDSLDESIDDIKSKIREIVKQDLLNAGQLTMASN